MSLDVRVLDVALNAPEQLVFLEEQDYASASACPVCGRSDASFLLADVRQNGSTSLESAFCRACEHRYFWKLPSSEWYQRYYSNGWDQGRQASRLAARLRRWPATRPLWRWLKEISSGADARAVQLFPFLLGVAQDDGIYFRKRSDVTKILEIGCGYGGTLREFQKRGFQVLGTEASPHRAQYCRDLGLPIIETLIDETRALEPYGPFDVAYSAHVLEHIEDPGAHLRHLAPLIRDGGYVYIQVPHVTLGEFFVARSHSAVHCHCFSPRSLALLLSANGFVPIRMQIDWNIHVLAQKSSARQALTFANTADPTQQIDELFGALASEQGVRLRLTWDHAYIRVVRLSDGRVVYERRLAFDIYPMAFTHTMDFSFTADDVAFPVHFLYENHPRPPMWIKQS